MSHMALKEESIRSWNWLIINEWYDVKSGKYTVFKLTHSRWVILFDSYDEKAESIRSLSWLIIGKSYDEKPIVHGPSLQFLDEGLGLWIRVTSRTYKLWYTFRTVYVSFFYIYDSSIMSRLEDRILSVSEG